MISATIKSAWVFGLLMVIATSGSAQKVFDVKDFGAKGNGLADDQAAIQSAIDSASQHSGAVVFFPAGTYVIRSYTRTQNYLENYMIELRSNIHLQGSGKETVLMPGPHLFDKKDTASNAHLFYGTNTEGVTFSDLVIDMNGAKNIVPEGALKNYAAVFTKRGADYHFRNVTFRNSAGRTMVNIMGKGRGLTIEECRFFNGGPYAGGGMANPFQKDFSFIYSEWDVTLVRNNTIEQQNVDLSLRGYTGGIELHGSNSGAISNTIRGCWPAIFITSSGGTLRNITISNNLIRDCLVGISFWMMDTIRNVEIRQNRIGLTFPRSELLSVAAGILMPNGNLVTTSPDLANNAPVYDLVIDSNQIEADLMEVPSAGMILHSLRNSVVSNNKLSGMNYAGIAVGGSAFGLDSTKICSNLMENFRPNNHPTLVAAFIVVTDVIATKLKSAGIRNLTIERNKFQGSKKSLAGKGKFLGTFTSLPKPNGARFQHNSFSDPAFYKDIPEVK